MTEKILKAVIIDRLLTQSEVVQITGLKTAAFEQWRTKGKGIHWVSAGTRAIIYRESAVIEFPASLNPQLERTNFKRTKKNSLRCGTACGTVISRGEVVYGEK